MNVDCHVCEGPATHVLVNGKVRWKLGEGCFDEQIVDLVKSNDAVGFRHLDGARYEVT